MKSFAPIAILAAMTLPTGMGGALAQQSFGGTAFPLGAKVPSLNLSRPGISAWQVERGGRLRLVTSPADESGQANARLEIELDPGFKTYWINPGPDGIPPQVAFGGSTNVGEATVTLPPPEVFREATVTVGYTERVSFEIDVRTAVPGRPFTLNAVGIVGFCADICVPVPFDLATGSPEGSAPASISQPQVERILSPSEGLRIRGATYDPASGRLDVDATVPDTDVLLELLVENAKGVSLPPVASRVHQTGADATFTFDVAPDTRIEDGRKLNFMLIVKRFGQDGRIGIRQRLEVSHVD